MNIGLYYKNIIEIPRRVIRYRERMPDCHLVYHFLYFESLVFSETILPSLIHYRFVAREALGGERDRRTPMRISRNGLGGSGKDRNQDDYRGAAAKRTGSYGQRNYLWPWVRKFLGRKRGKYKRRRIGNYWMKNLEKNGKKLTTYRYAVAIDWQQRRFITVIQVLASKILFHLCDNK